MFKTYLILAITSLQSLLGGSWNQEVSSVNHYAGISKPVITSDTATNNSVISYKEKLQSLGITLHPGTAFSTDSKATKMTSDHCESLVYATLKAVPANITKNLSDLTLYYADSGRRGLGGGSTIILRCQNVTDEELVGVFVHELGHIEDTGDLKGSFWSGESNFHDGKNPIYNNDPSLNFYAISFVDEKTIKSNASDLDFVSGYAKSDPFEDFAESFNFYLLHGSTFRKMAEQNQALAAKYQFLKETVFNNREFGFADKSFMASLNTRNYDATVINYDLKDFLAI